MAEREQHDVGLVIARLLLGALFLVTAYYKFDDPDGVARFLTDAGFPAANAFTWGAALLELVGGAALIVGVFPGPFALVLALYLVPTTLLFHRDLDQDWQITNLIKNTGVIGGLLAIWATRGGRIRLK